MSAAGPARAAGFWNLERGASTYSRGGANVADPGDGNALYLNPAGLAGLEGLQGLVDSSMVFDGRTFTRAPDDVDGDGRVETYDTVSNGWRPMPSPSVFLSYRLATLALPITVAAGVWGPPQIDRQWDEEGPQRYAEITAENVQVHYAAGAALELPWYGLRLGATGMLVSQVVRTSMRMSLAAPFGAGQEHPGYDANIAVDAGEHGIFNGVLGVSMQPHPRLMVAASYQPPYNVKAEGTAKVTLGKELASVATVDGEDVKLRLDMAPIARAAVRLLDPAGAYDVELALVWEGWSRNAAVRFAPQDISIRGGGLVQEVGVVRLDYDWRDTYSLRLGGSWDVLPGRLRVRGGTYYERGAVERSFMSPASFDFDKLGVTGGGRVELGGGVWADLALGWGHYLAGEVRDSQIRLVNIMPSEQVPERLWPVANGTYGNEQVFVLAAVGVVLDI